MGQRKNSIQVIWFFFKPYKRQFMALLVLSLLIGGLESVNIAAVYPILSTAFDTGTVDGNIIFILLGKVAGLLPFADEFIAYSVVFLVTALLSFIVKFISIRYRVKFSAKLIGNNQFQVFRKFVKADYQYFIDHKQGELIYNVATAPQRLSGLAASVTELISQVILSVSILALLITLSLPGTLIVLVVGIVYYLFTKYIGERVSYHSGIGEMEALRESNVILNETISGIKQVKIFTNAGDWIDRFGNTLKKRWYHFIRRNVWQQVPSPALMLILYICVGVIAILIRVVAPDSFAILIPVFGTFTFAVFRLIPVMGSVGDITMSVLGSLPDCETVYSILNDEAARIKDGSNELKSFKSKVEFDNVTFTHQGRRNTLKNVSVAFEKGKTTAIVGRSGSGKSTILNLLLRLFDPEEGEIKIDGLNIKEVKSISWLNKIGFVSQDTFIFNDTIRNNITFHSDQYSEEEIIKVAEYTEAHEFISELPNKYETLVGDRGVRLSGGQSQRVAVARAMIRNPEILIFDEATNALDNISEATVQKAIDKISRGHTVIIVAHRLSTIVNADKIIVLQDGRVVEQGTHQELIGKRGPYWELYSSQPN